MTERGIRGDVHHPLRGGSTRRWLTAAPDFSYVLLIADLDGMDYTKG